MSLGTRDYSALRSPSFGQGSHGSCPGALAKDSPLRRYDWVLVLAVVSLSLIGTLLVYSATQPSADPRAYFIKQLINVVLGLIFMVTVSLLDYRQIRMLAPIVYGAAVLGLIAVLSPLGTAVNGAKAWINLPAGFQVEPSEFAKIALVLMGALIFSELRDSERVPRPRDAAVVLACAVPIVMVVLQPALGVVILLLLITVGMIALSGLTLRWLAALAAAGLLARAGRGQAAPAEELPGGPADRVPAPADGPERDRLRDAALQDHDRLRWRGRHRLAARPAGHRQLRAQPADRLHLQRRG